MIPKITKGGISFKSALQYYLHDKEADTQERVEWAQTENMRTEDPQKAWRVMAYTAKEQDRLKEASGQSRAGRKLEKPVFAYSLAWHPEQKPNKAHMLETARESLQMMGLSEHECVIVAHRDEPQKHVHVIVNRVHPITGLAGDVRNSKRKFSDFAREYERKNGKIYCERREKNAKKREKGEKTRYGDPVIVEAWHSSRDGKEFVAALEREGYALAQGRKRPVVVDVHGKAHNPTRQLEGVKAKEFREKLGDLDLEKLPSVDEVIDRARTHDPEKEKRLEAFEILAARQLENMLAKHRNEQDKLKLKHRYQFESDKEQLVKHYQLREQKREIEKQAAKVKDTNWWKRLFGVTRKEQQQLNGQILSFRSSRERYREQLKTTTGKREREKRRLKQIHEKEQARLKASIERERKSERYSIRLQEPELARSHSRSRDDFGYER
ncbi:relaxase/mobilization nuclease domain-containing protein [Luteolibacter algae]|uniref:Relaxase/mobilization nuclease domain-containing protein n=1 Tax=Luteolibacter algae TaxID=454151 RepID=A0ABW5DB33_9BACT